MLARFLLMSLIASTASAAAPLDTYGRLPSIERAALSPDGSKIAFVQTAGDRRLIAIVALGDEHLVAALKLGDTKLRAMEWADEQHLLLTTASTVMPFELSGTKTEWHLMQVYDLQKNKVKGLLDHVFGSSLTMNVVYGRPVIQRKDGETVVYVHGLHVTDRTESALFRVNLTTGAERMIKEGGSETREWLVNDVGEIVAEQDYTESSRRWEIRLLRNGHVQYRASGVAPIDQPNMLGLSASGDAIIVALTEPGGVSWKPLSLTDGTWGADIAPNQRLTDMIRADGSQRMVGTAYVGDSAQFHFLDAQLQEAWDWIERTCRGDRVELVSMSADRSKLLVEVMGPTSGYAYLLADLKEHLTRVVGSVYDGVTQIAEIRRIRYAAADGLEIPGYMTLPPGRAAKKLPIIVLPHGGPQDRDRLEFDWWAQALAAQGYAVLQPNFRGSELGKAFVEAGYGQWGRKMQTDVSDGLRYLAGEGIVDPARACIVGASYGGYAALAGVTLEAGVYRCAVAVAGISDLASMLKYVRSESGYSDLSGVRYWNRFLDVDGPSDKKLDAISPLKHVDRITVPIMLIHGREDTVVPYDQSADMAKALKRAGKTVEFVALDKEDHHLSRSETRLQMLRTSVEFLRKYNPPD